VLKLFNFDNILNIYIYHSNCTYSFFIAGYCKHLQEEGWEWWQKPVPQRVVTNCSAWARCDLNVVHSNYISIEWSAREWILEPCHKPLFTM